MHSDDDDDDEIAGASKPISDSADSDCYGLNWEANKHESLHFHGLLSEEESSADSIEKALMWQKCKQIWDRAESLAKPEPDLLEPVFGASSDKKDIFETFPPYIDKKLAEEDTVVKLSEAQFIQPDWTFKNTDYNSIEQKKEQVAYVPLPMPKPKDTVKKDNSEYLIVKFPTQEDENLIFYYEPDNIFLDEKDLMSKPTKKPSIEDEKDLMSKPTKKPIIEDDDSNIDNNVFEELKNVNDVIDDCSNIKSSELNDDNIITHCKCGIDENDNVEDQIRTDSDSSNTTTDESTDTSTDSDEYATTDERITKLIKTAYKQLFNVQDLKHEYNKLGIDKTKVDATDGKKNPKSGSKTSRRRKNKYRDEATANFLASLKIGPMGEKIMQTNPPIKNPVVSKEMVDEFITSFNRETNLKQKKKKEKSARFNKQKSSNNDVKPNNGINLNEGILTKKGEGDDKVNRLSKGSFLNDEESLMCKSDKTVLKNEDSQIKKVNITGQKKKKRPNFRKMSCVEVKKYVQDILGCHVEIQTDDSDSSEGTIEDRKIPENINRLAEISTECDPTGVINIKNEMCVEYIDAVIDIISEKNKKLADEMIVEREKENVQEISTSTKENVDKVQEIKSTQLETEQVHNNCKKTRKIEGFPNEYGHLKAFDAVKSFRYETIRQLAKLCLPEKLRLDDLNQATTYLIVTLETASKGCTVIYTMLINDLVDICVERCQEKLNATPILRNNTSQKRLLRKALNEAARLMRSYLKEAAIRLLVREAGLDRDIIDVIKKSGREHIAHEIITFVGDKNKMRKYGKNVDFRKPKIVTLKDIALPKHAGETVNMKIDLPGGTTKVYQFVPEGYVPPKGKKIITGDASTFVELWSQLSLTDICNVEVYNKAKDKFVSAKDYQSKKLEYNKKCIAKILKNTCDKKSALIPNGPNSEYDKLVNELFHKDQKNNTIVLSQDEENVIQNITSAFVRNQREAVLDYIIDTYEVKGNNLEGTSSSIGHTNTSYEDVKNSIDEVNEALNNSNINTLKNIMNWLITEVHNEGGNINDELQISEAIKDMILLDKARRKSFYPQSVSFTKGKLDGTLFEKYMKWSQKLNLRKEKINPTDDFEINAFEYIMQWFDTEIQRGEKSGQITKNLKEVLEKIIQSRIIAMNSNVLTDADVFLSDSYGEDHNYCYLRSNDIEVEHEWILTMFHDYLQSNNLNPDDFPDRNKQDVEPRKSLKERKNICKKKTNTFTMNETEIQHNNMQAASANSIAMQCKAMIFSLKSVVNDLQKDNVQITGNKKNTGKSSVDLNERKEVISIYKTILVDFQRIEELLVSIIRQKIQQTLIGIWKPNEKTLLHINRLAENIQFNSKRLKDKPKLPALAVIVEKDIEKISTFITTLYKFTDKTPVAKNPKPIQKKANSPPDAENSRCKENKKANAEPKQCASEKQTAKLNLDYRWPVIFDVVSIKAAVEDVRKEIFKNAENDASATAIINTRKLKESLWPGHDDCNDEENKNKLILLTNSILDQFSKKTYEESAVEFYHVAQNISHMILCDIHARTIIQRGDSRTTVSVAYNIDEIYSKRDELSSVKPNVINIKKDINAKLVEDDSSNKGVNKESNKQTEPIDDHDVEIRSSKLSKECNNSKKDPEYILQKCTMERLYALYIKGLLMPLITLAREVDNKDVLKSNCLTIEKDASREENIYQMKKDLVDAYQRVFPDSAVQTIRKYNSEPASTSELSVEEIRNLSDINIYQIVCQLICAYYNPENIKPVLCQDNISISEWIRAVDEILTSIYEDMRNAGYISIGIEKISNNGNPALSNSEAKYSSNEARYSFLSNIAMSLLEERDATTKTSEHPHPVPKEMQKILKNSIVTEMNTISNDSIYFEVNPDVIQDTTYARLTTSDGGNEDNCNSINVELETTAYPVEYSILTISHNEEQNSSSSAKDLSSSSKNEIPISASFPPAEDNFDNAYMHTFEKAHELCCLIEGLADENWDNFCSELRDFVQSALGVLTTDGVINSNQEPEKTFNKESEAVEVLRFNEGYNLLTKEVMSDETLHSMAENLSLTVETPNENAMETKVITDKIDKEECNPTFSQAVSITNPDGNKDSNVTKVDENLEQDEAQQQQHEQIMDKEIDNKSVEVENCIKRVDCLKGEDNRDITDFESREYGKNFKEDKKLKEVQNEKSFVKKDNSIVVKDISDTKEGEAFEHGQVETLDDKSFKNENNIKIQPKEETSLAGVDTNLNETQNETSFLNIDSIKVEAVEDTNDTKLLEVEAFKYAQVKIDDDTSFKDENNIKVQPKETTVLADDDKHLNEKLFVNEDNFKIETVEDTKGDQLEGEFEAADEDSRNEGEMNNESDQVYLENVGEADEIKITKICPIEHDSNVCIQIKTEDEDDYKINCKCSEGKITSEGNQTETECVQLKMENNLEIIDNLTSNQEIKGLNISINDAEESNDKNTLGDVTDASDDAKEINNKNKEDEVSDASDDSKESNNTNKEEVTDTTDVTDKSDEDKFQYELFVKKMTKHKRTINITITCFDNCKSEENCKIVIKCYHELLKNENVDDDNCKTMTTNNNVDDKSFGNDNNTKVQPKEDTTLLDGCNKLKEEQNDKLFETEANSKILHSSAKLEEYNQTEDHDDKSSQYENSKLDDDRKLKLDQNEELCDVEDNLKIQAVGDVRDDKLEGKFESFEHIQVPVDNEMFENENESKDITTSLESNKNIKEDQNEELFVIEGKCNIQAVEDIREGIEYVQTERSFEKENYSRIQPKENTTLLNSDENLNENQKEESLVIEVNSKLQAVDDKLEEEFVAFGHNQVKIDDGESFENDNISEEDKTLLDGDKNLKKHQNEKKIVNEDYSRIRAMEDIKLAGNMEALVQHFDKLFRNEARIQLKKETTLLDGDENLKKGQNEKSLVNKDNSKIQSVDNVREGKLEGEFESFKHSQDDKTLENENNSKIQSKEETILPDGDKNLMKDENEKLFVNKDNSRIQAVDLRENTLGVEFESFEHSQEEVYDDKTFEHENNSKTQPKNDITSLEGNTNVKEDQNEESFVNDDKSKIQTVQVTNNAKLEDAKSLHDGDNNLKEDQNDISETQAVEDISAAKLDGEINESQNEGGKVTPALRDGDNNLKEDQNDIFETQAVEVISAAKVEGEINECQNEGGEVTPALRDGDNNLKEDQNDISETQAVEDISAAELEGEVDESQNERRVVRSATYRLGVVNFFASLARILTHGEIYQNLAPNGSGQTSTSPPHTTEDGNDSMPLD